ncbi:MAG: ATP-binding protein [Acidimicrobiia bacterium]|nr:ATP-binding protein [Acidimicrobiia bacterium]
MSTELGIRTSTTAIFRRFLAYYALTYVLLIGLMGYVVDRSAREALIEGVEANLEATAAVAQIDIPPEAGALADWAADVFAATGFRATLIAEDGMVLAESHSDPRVMENHSNRPEVKAALSGEVGVARRISSSTGFEQLYLALPPTDEGHIVRLSTPVRVVEETLGELRETITVIAVAAGLIGVGAVAWIARITARPITSLTQQTQAIAAGDLAITPKRSRIREFDQLGLALSEVAAEQTRRLAEASQASETLKTVLGAIPQGTLLVGSDDSIEYANRASRDLLGETPDDLSGLVPLAFQRGVREALRTGERTVTDADHGHPFRRLRALATPLPDEDRILVVVVDITEGERIDAVRRDFAANASHELKTPVATVLAAVEALQTAHELGDEDVSRFANQIATSARRLESLVTDLLDLSRLELTPVEATPVRLDLIAGDEVKRVRSADPDKEVSLDVSGSLVAMADHRDLSIAVRNLLDNAIRHTDSGDVIDVSLRSEGRFAVLTVTDGGDGIPGRDLGRIFERFYRVDSARSRDRGGTGLGLSIVKHVAERHSGSVEVESQLGVGSTFRLRIPLADEGSSRDRS